MADQPAASAQLNLNKGIARLAETYLQVQGQTPAYLSGNTSTLVLSGAGRLARVSVTAVSGNATGTIYDANAAGATTRPLYTIPATVGIVEVNMPVSYGIVALPAANMTVAISYSPAQQAV